MMNNDASPLLQFSEHLQKAQAIILSSHHFLCAKLGQCMVRSSLSWSEKTHSHSSFEDDLWLGFCDPFFSRLVFSRPVFVFYPDWTDRSKTVAWNTNLWKQVVAPWQGLQPQTFEDNGKYDNNKNGKCLTMDYLSVTLTLKCIHTWTSKCAKYLTFKCEFFSLPLTSLPTRPGTMHLWHKELIIIFNSLHICCNFGR